jgi:hypothetical protein
MYIVAIGWLYIVVLMAISETNWVAGILTFTFYGLFPLSILLWLFGGPVRRRRRAMTEGGEATQGASGTPAVSQATQAAISQEAGDSSLANQPAGKHD